MLDEKRILGITNDTPLGDLLARILEDQGAQVSLVANVDADTVRDALEVDLVILDLDLPGVNVFEQLEHLREANPYATIVTIDSVGGVASVASAIRSGADGYIYKRDLLAGGALDQFLFVLDRAMIHRSGINSQLLLDQARESFYAMITHDLKGPAATAKTALAMLKEDSGLDLSDDACELLDIAESSTNRLIALISSFLVNARSQAGKHLAQFNKANLTQVVEASVTELQFRERTKDIDWELSLDEEIIGEFDGKLVTLMMDNLLTNASKYTPSGGKISVSLKQESDHSALISVADTGIGIPASQIPLLFTPYHRLPEVERRSIHGTGLGLVVVKQIVDAHNGEISVTSNVGNRGTIFTIHLPLSPSSVDNQV
ncbi:MAG: hybrid sensor histidine kinase/response regulator [Chloroflexota bacterium]